MSVEFSILNGPHQGIALALTPGVVYTVGNHFDCDIFLKGHVDRASAQTPLSQTFVFFECAQQNDQIVFSKLAFDLFFSGSLTPVVAGTPYALPVQILCGQTELKIADPHAVLKPMEPDQNFEDGEAQMLNQTTLFDDATPQSQTQIWDEPLTWHDQAFQKVADFFSVWSAKTKAFFVKRSIELKIIYQPLGEKFCTWMKPRFEALKGDIVRLRLPLLIVLIALPIVFITGRAIFITTKHHEAVVHARNKVTSDNNTIKKLFINLPAKYNGIKQDHNRAGQTVFDGVVPTEADVSSFEKIFEPYNALVVYHITSSTQAVKAIRGVLLSQGLKHITAHFDADQGRMVLTGVVPSMDVLNDLELGLSTSTPQLGDIDTSQVYAQSDIEHELDDVLNQDNLGARLAVDKDWENDVITIQGYLEKSAIATLNSKLSDFTGHYGGILVVKVDVRDVLSAIPFRISQVFIGNPSMIVTQDGEKVFEGGQLDGMRIAKITQDSIIFSEPFPLTVKLNDILQ